MLTASVSCLKWIWTWKFYGGFYIPSSLIALKILFWFCILLWTLRSFLLVGKNYPLGTIIVILKEIKHVFICVIAKNVTAIYSQCYVTWYLILTKKQGRKKKLSNAFYPSYFPNFRHRKNLSLFQTVTVWEDNSLNTQCFHEELLRRSWPYISIYSASFYRSGRKKF